MSHLFRSEDMTAVRLTMTNEAAHDTIKGLGKFNKFHLNNLNEEANVQTESFMYYKKRVQAIAQWERRLRTFEDEMNLCNVAIPGGEYQPQEINEPDVLASLKQWMEPLEDELARNMDFRNQETRVVNEIRERSMVLERMKGQLYVMSEEVERVEEELRARHEAKKRGSQVELDTLESKEGGLTESLLGSDELKLSYQQTSSSRIGRNADDRFHNYICGVLPVAQQIAFDRILFRLSRGNAYARFDVIEEPVNDPETNTLIQKAVFYVVYIGNTLKDRIEKMCDYFKATRYDVPSSTDDIDTELIRLSAQLIEREQVLSQTSHQLRITLQKMAWRENNSPIKDWQEALRREKMICDALRMCSTPNGSIMVTAEGWIPSDAFEELNEAIRRAVRGSGAQPAVVQQMRTKQAPPTHFKVDKFTSIFQDIVNTYGVPRYKEANPGLFTIATFPFLFGIMYGDIGHGLILFIAGMYMLINESSLLRKKRYGELGEIFEMMFNGRYLITYMGFCAFYCGWIYNDCLSVPFDLFGTNWNYRTYWGVVSNNSVIINNQTHWDVKYGNITEAMYPLKTYPFGVDPGWYNTENELTFFNSLKMKISVTFGVLQMTFGIFLGLTNHLYFKKYVSVWAEFLPQLLFMLCTFGYMIFLIIFKFFIDWNNTTRAAPNLIQTMIGMFLSPGSVSDPLYDGQAGIQLFLVLIAVLCIPWMLLAKPYYEKWEHESRDPHANAPLLLDDDDSKNSSSHMEIGIPVAPHPEEEDLNTMDDDDEEEEYNFSEHMIHQAIHTIEFVLGCVSNTASYLRLWALSLAHAELANVFWNKLIISFGVEGTNPIFIFITFGAWAGATVAVLLCMDALECFLHALRLHWVEFQNKFFNADGYAFEPFSFMHDDDVFEH